MRPVKLPDGRGEYFERLYAKDGDPWDFEHSWYEQRKYALTMAALPHVRYHSAFEPGCSIGVLTEMLAERCDAVLAIDMVASAVRQAATRLAAAPHVRVEHRSLGDGWPTADFDLIMLSEIAYYFPADELQRLLVGALATLRRGGTLVAVHWRGPTDYALTAEQVHRQIDETPTLRNVAHYEEEKFLLDAWEVAS
jgi:protein-L-isoaspartate O-methyltransferase